VIPLSAGAELDARCSNAPSLTLRSSEGCLQGEDIDEFRRFVRPSLDPSVRSDSIPRR